MNLKSDTIFPSTGMVTHACLAILVEDTMNILLLQRLVVLDMLRVELAVLLHENLYGQ